MIETIETWLRRAAVRVHEEAPHLTSLDQAIGDGDHGINLDRGFQAVVKALDARPAPDPAAPTPTDPAATAELLRLVGRTLISTVGGASGPLYGTAFLRASASVAGAPGDATGGQLLADALSAAATGVAGLGKSTTGEKTMLDGLVPGAAAAQAAVGRGAASADVAAAARDAARDGAEATIPMLATKGRASYLGERSIGHQDPGATSLALLLDVLADSFA
jgi:dihydroxyacetone kinase-like protein